MGTWATYVIGADGEDPPAAYFRYGGTAPGWAWWELPSMNRDDDAGLAAAGPAIVAHILASDVADIRGLTNGQPRWRWLYGEDALAAYEDREADGSDLEIHWPERATETAGLIVTWAAEAGLPNADPEALAKALQRNYVFAEELVGDLLRLLRLVSEDSTVEPRQLEPTDVRLCEVPAAVPPPAPDERAMAGVHAAVIDRTSRAWCNLVATRWLSTFGEPAAVVAFDSTVYVASDPPVTLGEYHGSRGQVAVSLGLTGRWQEVPTEDARSVVAAAAWAREHVGAPGRPADPDRVPLNGEVSPDYPGGPDTPTTADWWKYSIAAPPSLGIELAMGAPLTDRADAVADWLDHARSTLVKPVVEAYTDEGGFEDYGAADYIRPYAIWVRCSYRTASGRVGNLAPDDTGWALLLSRLRSGELTSVELTVDMTNGLGQVVDVSPWGTLQIGAELAADQRSYSLPAHLTVRVPYSLWVMAGQPFVDETVTEDLVARAAASLPVVGGWVDVARSFRMGNDLSRYEAFAGVQSDARRDPRVCSRGPAWRLILGAEHLRLLGGRQAVERTGLFDVVRELESVDGPLLILQCGDDPDDCTAERREAMARALAVVMPGKVGSVE
jgi:hypothetical protein